MRTAWLQENGLTEPRYPGDLADQMERAVKEIAERYTQKGRRVRKALEHILQEAESAQRTLPAVTKSKLRFDWSAEPLKGKARADDIKRRMKEFKRRNPGLDFGRER